MKTFGGTWGRAVVRALRFVALPAMAAALFAQPQIGGGTCTSATLSGNYSLTLTGRSVTSGAAISTVLLGVGSVNFDGLSKVSATFAGNSPKASGTASTWSGTYSLQANCVGVVTINLGDTATFTLESYNQGKSYLLTGQDGTYVFAGNGGTLPATCAASQASGVYAFNGTGFTTSSGAVTGVADFSGLLTFDGVGAVTGTWYISTGGSTKAVSTSGTYKLVTGCAGTVTMTDASGGSYSLELTQTGATGGFIVGGTTPQMVFTASGRVL